MNLEYWLQSWKLNHIGFNQNNPNVYMQQYFPLLKLVNGARILVPLCGKSIDMLWMLKEGYQVFGVDISRLACESFFIENHLAYREIKQDGRVFFEGKNIILIVGDFFELDAKMLGEVDAVYDRASLIALPVKSRQQYAEFINYLLSPGVKVLLIAVTYDQTKMQGPPFSVSETEVNALFSKYFTITKLHDKPAQSLPVHLQAKGLNSATNQIYLMVK